MQNSELNNKLEPLDLRKTINKNSFGSTVINSDLDFKNLISKKL